MKLKLQHFYLVLAVAATVVTLCLPLVQFIYADGAETMSNFRLTHLDALEPPERPESGERARAQPSPLLPLFRF